MTEIYDLSLDRIVIVPDLQPRVAGLDEAHIRALEDAVASWPPLVAVAPPSGGRPVLADGYHRVAAAQNLGLATVPVRIVPMPADGDLHALAFALNAAHGRHLTLTDRRAFAERSLRQRPEVSNMEVARRAGLSPTTVATIRERLEADAAITPAPERVGVDGSHYSVGATRSPRPPGALPESGLGELVSNAVGRLLTSEERRQQRKIAQYLRRLVVALEDGDTLEGWDTAEAAADACRLVLGDAAAADLGERLGRMSRTVLNVALALGYDEAEPGG